jgi:hypothetical protein
MNFHDEYDTGMEDKFRLPFYKQGIPTSPQTPNQIQELSKAMNMGVKNVEIGTISPDVFETIPIQHFEEMRRLAKLSGAKTSLHAPIIDAAGFTQQGWSEQTRRQSEKHINSVLDRAYKLDPEGNIPVTMHSTGAMIPGDRYKRNKDGEMIKESILAVNRETGKLIDLNRKEKNSFFGGKESKSWGPKEQLESINAVEWDDKKLDLASSYNNLFYLDQELNNAMSEEYLTLKAKESMGIKSGIKNLNEDEKNKLERLNHNVKSVANRQRLYGEEIMKKVENMYDIFIKNKPHSTSSPKEKEQYQNDLTKLKKMKQEISHEEGMLDQQGLFQKMSEIKAPKTWVTSEEFNKEKTSDTISSNALYAYGKYGDKAPVISLENVYGDVVSSRADTLKSLIKEGREKFANKLVDTKGMDKKSAKQVAERLIGATWDLGHINLLRKQGFTEKEIIKEAKKIAPVVKHVHITDNFGFSDSHLAPGMGNVPIKEQLKEISKEAKDVRHIIEAGAYAGQFKDNPVPHTLESMNSPIYQYEAGPSWGNVRDVYGSYMNMGDILPNRYFSEFGTSFARLPKELGGQLWNEKSKFSGTPN